MRVEAIRSGGWMLAVVVALGAVPARAQWTEDQPARSSNRAPSQGRAGGYRPVGVLLRMGLDAGGDELASVEFSNGDSTKVRAGGLVSFAGGILFHPDAPFALEGTIGYKIDQAKAENGKISFSRVPVDVIASFAHGGHRLGAGGTIHLSPTYSCKVDGFCDGSVSYDNALGGIVQYAYGWGRDHGFELGVRGTLISYKRNGLPTLSGNCVGVILGGWL